jgi:hypothetical protein
MSILHTPSFCHAKPAKNRLIYSTNSIGILTMDLTKFDDYLHDLSIRIYTNIVEVITTTVNQYEPAVPSTNASIKYNTHELLEEGTLYKNCTSNSGTPCDLEKGIYYTKQVSFIPSGNNKWINVQPKNKNDDDEWVKL